MFYEQSVCDKTKFGVYRKNMGEVYGLIFKYIINFLFVFGIGQNRWWGVL